MKARGQMAERQLEVSGWSWKLSRCVVVKEKVGFYTKENGRKEVMSSEQNHGFTTDNYLTLYVAAHGMLPKISLSSVILVD